MKLTKSLIIMTVVISLFLAMPTLASVGSSTGNLAYDNNAAGTGKLIYKARLTAAQETVPVIDSTARGSFIFRTTPAGDFVFGLKVRKLSGAPTGAHIHGPAGPGVDAGVVYTLCGGDNPCSFENGMLILTGSFDPALLSGITPEQFMEYLDTGMLYVNVHTELNPAGEARGQLYLKGATPPG